MILQIVNVFIDRRKTDNFGGYGGKGALDGNQIRDS